MEDKREKETHTRKGRVAGNSRQVVPLLNMLINIVIVYCLKYTRRILSNPERLKAITLNMFKFVNSNTAIRLK